jgi:hypothetical protein
MTWWKKMFEWIDENGQMNERLDNVDELIDEWLFNLMFNRMNAMS